MKRALTLASVFIGIPTAVSGQSTANIYLDCDVTRYYKGVDEGKTLRDRLYFEVNIENSDVMEFDIDRGKYELLCGAQNEDYKFTEAQGSCLVGDEIISVSSNKRLLMLTNWKTLFFYRASGRLTGSDRLYQGSVTDVIDALEKTPIVDYDIRGTCQQGVDMSKAKKAF